MKGPIVSWIPISKCSMCIKNVLKQHRGKFRLDIRKMWWSTWVRFSGKWSWPQAYACLSVWTVLFNMWLNFQVALCEVRSWTYLMFKEPLSICKNYYGLSISIEELYYIVGTLKVVCWYSLQNNCRVLTVFWP